MAPKIFLTRDVAFFKVIPVTHWGWFKQVSN